MSEVQSKKESWRDVPGTTLQASNLGRLRNKVGHNPTLKLVWVGREGLKSPKVCYQGKMLSAAMMVCRAWKGLAPTPKHLCICIDGDRANLTPSNLKWVTQGDISRLSYQRGRAPTVVKPNLSLESVALIQEFFAAGWTRLAIARKLGVSVACVSRRVAGQAVNFGKRDISVGVVVEPPPKREIASVPYQGRMVSISEWSKLTGNCKNVLYGRMRRGMSREEAANAPKFYNRKNKE